MNYNRIYNNIIEKAKLTEYKCYTEKHHIIPKCLGGTNDASNIIILSAREHFLCHLLLAKEHNTKELWFAFFMMKAGNKKHSRINSHLFERYKKKQSEMMSGKNNPMYGKPSACISHTAETKEKIKQSKLGKKRAPFTRSKPTAETIAKMSKTLTGRVFPKKQCPHCKRDIATSVFNRHHGDNCKDKMPL